MSFSYATAEFEETACNLCTGTGREIVSRRDRNGLDVQSVICTECGLIYICPRMTAPWYDQYYAQEYRDQMARFYGSDINSLRDLDLGFEKQQRHGDFLAAYHAARRATSPTSVLDIGSSTGGTLEAFSRRYRASVQGIEPGAREAGYANSRGIPTTTGLFEQTGVGDGRKFDLVLCVLTFNHLLDPRGSTRRVADLLTPDGLFLVEVLDFFQCMRYWGERDKAIQIDHVYMFAPETLSALLEQGGLEVVPGSLEVDSDLSGAARRDRRRAGLPFLHVRVLARRRSTPSTAPSRLYPVIRSRLGVFRPAPRLSAGRRRWERLLMRIGV